MDLIRAGVLPDIDERDSAKGVRGDIGSISESEDPLEEEMATHVAKSQTGLRDFTFTFHFQALEKEMATHSSVLAWRISGTREPGGLPSMGSHRVGHDRSDLAAEAAAIEDS